MYAEPPPYATNESIPWDEFLECVDALTSRLPVDLRATEQLVEFSSELSMYAAERRLRCVRSDSDAARLLMRATELLALDPSGRDPFWVLREAVDDLERALGCILDGASESSSGSPGCAYASLVRLVGIDRAGQLDHILADDNPEITRLVALLVRRLSRSRDGDGTVAWFETRRAQLGNRTPAEVIVGQRQDAERLLLPLVGGG